MEAAFVGVVGTLLGTIVGWVLTRWTEREKWRREDRYRWYTERLEAYSSFMAAAKECVDRGRIWRSDLRDPMSVGTLHELTLTVSQRFQVVRLLAPAPVLARALHLNIASEHVVVTALVADLTRLGLPLPPGIGPDEGTTAQAVAAFEQAHNEFASIASADLEGFFRAGVGRRRGTLRSVAARIARRPRRSHQD